MLNTTMLKEDIKEQHLSSTLKQLQNTAFSLFWQGVPFSREGILRHRWRISRWSDQWQYAKALASVAWERSWNIVDLAGAASLPVYHLALEGCVLTTVDEDPELAESARKFSEDKNLTLAVIEKSPLDVDLAEPGEADWVLCLSCLENHTPEQQIELCKKFSSFLKKGGILTATFQYGSEAPAPHAPRTPEDVNLWVRASGLSYLDDEKFTDRQKRYPLDPRQPERLFTCGALFLVK